MNFVANDRDYIVMKSLGSIPLCLNEGMARRR